MITQDSEMELKKWKMSKNKKKVIKTRSINANKTLCK